jgi:LPXTG-site transpeptidase (sortase) family protein
MSRTAVVLPQVNNALFAAVCIVGAYLILAPALPRIQFYFRSLSGPNPTLQYDRDGVRAAGEVEEDDNRPIPEDNALVIKKIGVDGIVHEGKNASTLTKGVWHRPGTGTPEDGGNTVLVAHRFLYTSGSNTFYNLDKMAEGDRVTLYWGGKKYRYEVQSVGVVAATDLYIEAPTREPTLTLYTCTPLFTARYRLVVTARLIP